MSASSDVFSTAKRSAVMRAVKSRDTTPELQVRAAVRALGYARRCVYANETIARFGYGFSP